MKERKEQRDDNNATGAQWVETKLRPAKSAYCGSIVKIGSRKIIIQ